MRLLSLRHKGQVGQPGVGSKVPSAAELRTGPAFIDAASNRGAWGGLFYNQRAAACERALKYGSPAVAGAGTWWLHGH